MFRKPLKILKEIIPILLMIGLIPFIQNDYTLTLIYVFIIIISFILKREKNDFIFLIFGFIAMMIAEYIFISTGVETFIRNSLFGLMPLWLPFLWSYAFVVIGRSIKILEG
jgi:hypothetical protein